MNTGFMIITNNPLVQEKLGEDYHVEYEELSYEDTLKKVQKMIFQGYKLLTHPLSGSVKPNETPYKSVCSQNRRKVWMYRQCRSSQVPFRRVANFSLSLIFINLRFMQTSSL